MFSSRKLKLATGFSLFFVLGCVNIWSNTFKADKKYDYALFREDFSTMKGWQPTIRRNISNRSSSASLKESNNTMIFQVPEPDKGERWTRPCWLSITPDAGWIVLRYKAENCADSKEFLIGFQGGEDRDFWAPITLSDIRSDGKWHTVAVNLSTSGITGKWFDQIFIGLKADRQGNAKIALDYVKIVDVPPVNCDLVGVRDKSTRPNVNVALVPESSWVACPTWVCQAPVGKASVNYIWASKALRFQLEKSGTGMKWKKILAKPVELKNYKLLFVRYRAKGISTSGGSDVYALALLSVAGGVRKVFSMGSLIADGKWHSLNVNISGNDKIKTLALQVIAVKPNAFWEISDISFCNSPKNLNKPISDNLSLKRGHLENNLKMIDLSQVCNASSSKLLKGMKLASWFKRTDIFANNIPFQLSHRQTNDVVATSFYKPESVVSIPVNTHCSEIYLLMFARMTGYANIVAGGDVLHSIDNVESFQVMIKYKDGTCEKQFPVSLPEGKYSIKAGGQVMCVFTNPKKEIESLQIADFCRQAAFYIAGVTANLSKQPYYTNLQEKFKACKIKTTSAKPISPSIVVNSNKIIANTSAIKLEIAPVGGLKLIGLFDKLSSVNCLVANSRNYLLDVRINGKYIYPDLLKVRKVKKNTSGGVDVDISVKEADAYVNLTVSLSVSEAYGLSIKTLIQNTGKNPIDVGLKFNSVALRINTIQDTWYCYPQRGIVVDNKETSFVREFSTEFPMQFISVYNPKYGSGISLLTKDKSALMRKYFLNKNAKALWMGVEYSSTQLAPQKTLSISPVCFNVTNGDWHGSFNMYKTWLDSFYKPYRARKDWFRRVFTVRHAYFERFFPFYYRRDTGFNIKTAIENDIKTFGDIDFVHFYDWGYCNPFSVPNGGPAFRSYGRTGDTDPSIFWKGGWQAFCNDLDSLKSKGIKFGFYIEGYLYDSRGKLSELGPRAQIISKDGKGLRPPGVGAMNPQLYMCPGNKEWLDVQTSTYKRIVKTTGADGMYIDSVGFGGKGRSCWSHTHGHSVPLDSLAGEQILTKAVSDAVFSVNHRAVVYTETNPTDIGSIYQDGSWSYALEYCARRNSRFPINLFRFAIPGYKGIELLNLHGPLDSWGVTGMNWIFFNGGAILLQGPGAWYSPKALAVIRKCHAIMKKYADAFASDKPEPLIPTEQAGVLANYFPSSKEALYTLYNNTHRTINGIVLKIPHKSGKKYYDVWNGKDIEPVFKNGFAYLPYSLDPKSVGCIVVK